MGELTFWELQLGGVVLLLASLLQATVGFAAGLFGIPLLMLAVGASLPQAVMTMLLASFMQNLGGVFSLRGEVTTGEVTLPILIRLATIPLGVGVLWLSETWLSPQHVKMILGMVLLVLVGMQWFAAPTHAMPLHEIWRWIAFSTSGFLVGFCGMGGPPMVLWVMAQPWTSSKSRAFLFLMFLSSLVPHCLLLYLTFGAEVNQAWWLYLWGIPWILGGTWLGLKLGAALPKSRLRPLVYVILVLTAVAAIVSPFVGNGATQAESRVDIRPAAVQSTKSTPNSAAIDSINE